LTAAVVALLALAVALPARGALDVSDYRRRLERIDGLLGEGDAAGAAREAGALLHEEIRWGAETLHADGTVLEPIVDEDEAVRGPLRNLIAALATAEQMPQSGGVDATALASLAARQAERGARKSGALPGAPEARISFVEQVWRWIATASTWFRGRILELWRWLTKLWPAARAGGAAGEGGINYVVFAVAGAILVVVAALAVRAARRGGEDAPGPRARARPADADADPLSRSANEWEDRARALASQGKPREAIRAWYHALLVSSFRAGVLHHRRGRTNREYAHALPAEVPWRGQFAELTGRFDVEWYGHAESSPDTLEAFSSGARRILASLGTQP
jgi:hypothetical protein